MTRRLRIDSLAPHSALVTIVGAGTRANVGGFAAGVGSGLAAATCASNEAPAAMATAPAAAIWRKRRRGSASSAMQRSHMGVSFGWDSTRDQRHRLTATVVFRKATSGEGATLWRDVGRTRYDSCTVRASV